MLLSPPCKLQVLLAYCSAADGTLDPCHKVPRACISRLSYHLCLIFLRPAPPSSTVYRLPLYRGRPSLSFLLQRGMAFMSLPAALAG
ncbi:hypothetical protein XA68_16144 [Ophiocordyceps unilateralis]|uniref:Uncharacterized protein n=1 Tax=Ophiocordyceps unilateralis TaxID=268505 RepID=A0A2A9P765_OPHUN|nr:hypothetical protein XA68_16144 [Ophiocordyceps unilateralis]